MITPEALATLAAESFCGRIVIQTHMDPQPLTVVEAWAEAGTLYVSLDVPPPAEPKAPQPAPAEAVACLREVITMLQSGELVRDISKDADPDWARRMLGFVQKLNRWTVAAQ